MATDFGTDDEGETTGAFYAGAGLTTAGLGAVYLAYYYFGREERDARGAAFMTYDDSLMQQLKVCAEGTRIVDCADDPSPETGKGGQASWGNIAP